MQRYQRPSTWHKCAKKYRRTVHVNFSRVQVSILKDFHVSGRDFVAKTTFHMAHLCQKSRRTVHVNFSRAQVSISKDFHVSGSDFMAKMTFDMAHFFE